MNSEYLKKYINDLNRVGNEISTSEFNCFVEELVSSLKTGNQIFVFGNGGSGANVSHFACDINKGVSYGKENRFRVICLNDNIPVIASYANDLDYSEIYAEQLRNFMNKGDLVIGVSGSGNSPNVLKAIDYAVASGGRTFGISGSGGVLQEKADNSIEIPSRDMQQIEDLQQIIFHAAMKILKKDSENYE